MYLWRLGLCSRSYIMPGSTKTVLCRSLHLYSTSYPYLVAMFARTLSPYLSGCQQFFNLVNSLPCCNLRPFPRSPTAAFDLVEEQVPTKTVRPAIILSRSRQDKVSPSANIQHKGILSTPLILKESKQDPAHCSSPRVRHSPSPRHIFPTTTDSSPPPLSCPCSKHAHYCPCHHRIGRERGSMTSRSIPIFPFVKTPSNHHPFPSSLSPWHSLTYAACTAPQNGQHSTHL